MSMMGIALAGSFIAATALGIRRRHKSGLSSAEVIQVISLIAILAFAGSKLYYILIHYDRASFTSSSYWSTTTGSGSYGAVIGGLLAILFYARSRALEFAALAKHLWPSWLAASALGRMGCFISGCCYGLPSPSTIGIRYSIASPAGARFPNQYLIPTQLFEVIMIALLLAGLLFAERSSRTDSPFAGFALIGYSAIRICVDFFRYYPEYEIVAHIFYLRIVISQVASLLLAAFGVIFIYRFRARR